MKFGTWELNLALEYLLHMDTIVCTTKSLWGQQVLEDPQVSSEASRVLYSGGR